MCLTTQSEIESMRHSKAIPLRDWVPEVFDDSQPLTLKPGRYGVDPAPVSDDDGLPLTRREALFFWLPVWFACVVLGIVVGFAFFEAKAWVHQL